MHPSPSLLRNYDYAPDLFEQVSLSTDYLQPVIGTGDCLWGLLDGMNAAGLAVSLAYGGDRTSGEGFAIPIVLRYLLETCETTEQAEAALARLPIAMAYNVTMIDAQGTVRTAHLRPATTPSSPVSRRRPTTAGSSRSTSPTPRTTAASSGSSS